MTYSPVAVSAPGKVLFAGGFLVLDRKHTGLVFGLDARIHVHIEPLSPNVKATEPDHSAETRVLVESPQFRDAKWLYAIETSKPAQGEAVGVSQLVDADGCSQSRNKFVETTLRYVLTYLFHLQKDITIPTKIVILADNDYYSQTAEQVASPRGRFHDFGVKLSDAHKTGLGSSAALVTSLVSGLLAFYTTEVEQPPQRVHNLAQAAHCAAQGKVGSGFDVAAAVFGSCLYRRFTPVILETVGEPTSSGFGERLHLCVEDLNLEQKWDTEIISQSVRIPDNLRLVMCDVDCGSETPGMVRKVLQWRKDNPTDAELLWTAIQHGSNELCAELSRMASLGRCNKEDQQKLTDIIATIRSFVKDMSLKSEVPIEPDVITELLNHCTSIPGVVGGVAPGAGGYDAVALLIQHDVEVRKDLEQRLIGWKAKDESTGAKIGKVRLLGVEQANVGLKIEDVNSYGDWV